MGLREKINDNSRVVAGVVVLLVLISGYVIFRQLTGSGVTGTTRAYYTIDDGATWFEDDINKAPPFMHDGKEALRAYVYSCSGKPFVAFVEKYTPEFKRAMDAYYERMRSGKTDPKAAAPRDPGGHMYKKPGVKEWANGMGPKTAAAVAVRCTDGGDPQALIPR